MNCILSLQELHVIGKIVPNRNEIIWHNSKFHFIDSPYLLNAGLNKTLFFTDLLENYAANSTGIFDTSTPHVIYISPSMCIYVCLLTINEFESPNNTAMKSNVSKKHRPPPVPTNSSCLRV